MDEILRFVSGQVWNLGSLTSLRLLIDHLTKYCPLTDDTGFSLVKEAGVRLLIDQDDTLQGEKETGMRPELSLSLPYSESADAARPIRDQIYPH